MEKVICICGQDVRFKATGALPLRYKTQFGRDLFADMAVLEAAVPAEEVKADGGALPGKPRQPDAARKGTKAGSAPAKEAVAGCEEEPEEKAVAMDMSKLDTELFYNIAWTMAKCADPSLPPVLDWLDRFETFPVFDVFNELQDMLVQSFQVTKN